MKILVITDIHGNASALEAVLNKEEDIDGAIFLGDALLSGPQANETMALLDRLKLDIAIMGNHDEEVLNPSIFSGWPAEWVALNEWILDQLEAGTAETVENFSSNGEYEIDGMELYLHHGELEKGKPAALPNAPEETFAQLDAGSSRKLILFGHTHVQFERQIGLKTYINPGSVGQPRCGKLHACYGVFLDRRYEARQVAYDPTAWLTALDAIPVLKEFPDFHKWLRVGLLSGYGIGEREPWTQFAAEGYC